MSNPSDTPRTYTPAQWLESVAVKVYDALYKQQKLLHAALDASGRYIQGADWYRDRFRSAAAWTSGSTPEAHFVGIMVAFDIPRWQDFATAKADAALLEEIDKLNAECRASVDRFDPGNGPHRDALRAHVHRRALDLSPATFAELDRIRADWSNIAAAGHEAIRAAIELTAAVRRALRAQKAEYYSRRVPEPPEAAARKAEADAVAAVLAGKLPLADFPARLTEIAADFEKGMTTLREEERAHRLCLNLMRIPRKFDPERHDPARVPNPGAFALVEDHFARLARELKEDDWPPPLRERNILCFGSKGRGKTRALWRGLHILMRADEMVWPGQSDLAFVNAAELADEIADLARTDTDALRAKVNFLAGRHEEPGVDCLCEFLVIDDLSKAPLTERYGRELYKIINARYEAGLPIYVTTQDGPAELVRAMARGDADVERKLAAIIRRLTQDGDALMIDFDAEYPAPAKEERP